MMITWVYGDFFDNHLGRLMIIWDSPRFKPSLSRQACVRGIRDDHLGLWDCGTVGLLRALE